jgi:MYXO-CTERM domain-containing protein
MTITADQLAAGVAAGGKDSCQGDSGGPLIVMNGAEPMLAGIVSWGAGCARANTPGLYARLSSFASWMDTYAGGPPTAVAGADLTVGKGAAVQLDATASTDTAFGEITSYAWSQVGGPSVTLAGADAMLASFTAPSTTGVIELELTVRDEGGNSSTDRIQVTVAANGGGGGSGGGTGGGTGEGGTGGDADDNAIYGGCSAGGGGNGSVMLLVGLGLLVARRRRT